MTFQRLADQNYYEVLDVSKDASPEEIQSAYEDAREIFSHDDLVSGSILSEQERRRAAERIAQAYQTLIAEESRRLYDESLGIRRETRRIGYPRAVHRREASFSGPSSREENHTAAESETLDPHGSDAGKPPLQLGATEEASGEFLRRARETMGLDLGTIARETKIGRSMLEYIEDERLDRLPAPIYLRNFTQQIARCLGLDEEKVSRTYLARIQRLQSRG